MVKSLLIIADFNVQTLAGYLLNDIELPQIKPVLRPFGQVMQELLNPCIEEVLETIDYSLIWTRPQAVISSYKKVQQFEELDLEVLFKEVDEFAAILKSFGSKAGPVFIPLWSEENFNNSTALIDLKANTGPTYILQALNLRFMDNLAGESNIHFLDTNKWILSVGKEAFNPKLYYLSKSPFGNHVYKSVVTTLKSSINGLLGNTRKLIILDLDDTLWGGIVGDLGWENIRLGGHDGIGEAFVDFQQELKALKNKGILLAIVSKNEESVALEAINQHPEMVLTQEDFVGWRVNWNDKARNIAELVKELNLGLQSVVFIDDNPVERDRVKQSLPEVFVPEWPKDKMRYTEKLFELSCFNTPSINKEDANRTRMYIDEKKRQTLLETHDNLDAWLKSLEMVVKIEPLNSANLQRTVQLFNKTNQMNLSTRRFTVDEMQAWAAKDDTQLWVFYVSDKFGDSGLTGIVSTQLSENQVQIVDFILSCRVFGRKVEEIMLAQVYKYAKETGSSTINARYLPTKKNKPTLSFFTRSGFNENKDQLFSWDLKHPYSYPEGISIISN